MNILYLLLVVLAFWLVSRMFLPRAITWFFDLFTPSERKLDVRAEEGEELRRRSLLDPVAARQRLEEARKTLQSLRPSDPGESADVRKARYMIRNELIAELGELESHMRSKGWLSEPAELKRAEPRLYDWDVFKDDLGINLLMSGVYCLIAAVPLALWEAWGVIQHLTGSPEAPPLRQMAGFPLVVFAGYVVASLGVTLGVFLLRPLRRWILGWMLSGSVIAASIYGGIGLAAALAYVWFGVNIMDYESPEDAWKIQRYVLVIMAVAGAPAGLYFWFTDDGDQ